MAAQKEFQERIDRIQTKIDAGDHEGAKKDLAELDDALGYYERLKPSQRRAMGGCIQEKFQSFEHVKSEKVNFAELEQQVLKDSEQKEPEVPPKLRWKS